MRICRWNWKNGEKNDINFLYELYVKNKII